MSHRKPFRIAAAALSAALILAPVTATSAFAADPVPLPATNVNPATDVSLTIHKYQGPTWDPTQCPANGEVLPATCTGTALQGAKFKVTPVLYNGAAIDLTTNAGWKAAADFFTAWGKDPAALPDGYSLGTGTTQTTNASGLAEFTGTKTLYIVEEVTPPPAGEGASYTPAQPFAVTLPMGKADGSGWLYDVHAYPKNNKDDISKSVEDAGAGSVTNPDLATVTYTLKTSITSGYVTSDAATGTKLTKYEIYDTLDPRLTPPAAAEVYVQGDTYAKTTLAAGDDYTYSVTGQKVTIELTQAGRDKLVTAKNADATAYVYTVLKPTLTDANCYATPEPGQVACTGVVDGLIKNTASFIPNQSGSETSSNTVESKYADIQVKKTNAVTPAAALAGAKFDLYQTDTCSAAGVAGKTPVASGVTDNAGQYTWKSLLMGKYCLVETEAPVGYVLPENPYTAVTLADGSVQVGAVLTTSITNMQREGNQLPLTGGQGVAAMSVAGLLLVGGGVAYYAASSKRRDDEA